MPRFFKLRDGCDWLWTDVMQAEEMIESFAYSIQSDTPDTPIEELIPKIKVFRYAEPHRLAGQVSRLEARVGSHYWVAERETT